MQVKAMYGFATLTLLAVVGCNNGEAQSGRADVPAGPSADVEAAAGPAVRPETRSFREWYAACDNGNTCVAYTGTDSGGWLMVRQAAGPGSAPEVLVGGSPFPDEGTDGILSLSLDGERQTLSAGSSETGSQVVPDDAVRDTLRRLASARALAVGTGEADTALPTAGASAALLWIDERQGRLDTTTALIRRGDRPASTVPPAPLLPRVVPAAAIDQGEFARASDPGEQGAEADLTLPATIEALPEVKQCRADTAFNAWLQKAVLAARLTPDTELWGVPCDAGAYNAMYDFYLSGPGGANPRKAEFPGWEPRERMEGDIAGDGLVNPVFDARTSTLRHFPRARGIGDCGTIQSWAWTGRAFVLTSESAMGNCWGMPASLWPTIWRTR